MMKKFSLMILVSATVINPLLYVDYVKVPLHLSQLHAQIFALPALSLGTILILHICTCNLKVLLLKLNIESIKHAHLIF